MYLFARILVVSGFLLKRLSPLNFLSAVVRKQLLIYVFIFGLKILFIDVYAFMPVPYCLDYASL